MLLVGVIEMIAGLLVALKPRFGSYVVAAWLWGIIVNLLLIPGYYAVALRCPALPRIRSGEGPNQQMLLIKISGLAGHLKTGQ